MSVPEDEQNTLASLDAIPWRDHHEKLFIEWGDKALCYKWLHNKSYKIYINKYHWYVIPVIIMSTLTGTANFAQGRVPIEYQPYAQMAIGGINIFAGILTTISQFLKVSELVESHKISYVSWDKFYRSVKVEMGKDRKDRVPVMQFLRKSQDQYNNLMETSPDIDDSIIEMFMKTFTSTKTDVLSAKKNEIYKNFNEIHKPDICNELISTSNFLAPPLIPQPILQPNYNHNTTLNENKKMLVDTINDFITQFEKKKCRIPTKDEIIDNIDNVDEDDIEFILNFRKNEKTEL